VTTATVYRSPKNGRSAFETTRYGRTPPLNVAGARTTLPWA
jgi:hypothetical protein